MKQLSRFNIFFAKLKKKLNFTMYFFDYSNGYNVNL